LLLFWGCCCRGLRCFTAALAQVGCWRRHGLMGYRAAAVMETWCCRAFCACCHVGAVAGDQVQGPEFAIPALIRLEWVEVVFQTIQRRSWLVPRQESGHD
jgi:hypothetical protein